MWIGLQIAREANLQSDPSIGNVLTQTFDVSLGIFDLVVGDHVGIEEVRPVADAVRLQVCDGLKDTLGAVGFAGVYGLLEEMLVSQTKGFDVIVGRIAEDTRIAGRRTGGDVSTTSSKKGALLNY